jgi:hypothetical protein
VRGRVVKNILGVESFLGNGVNYAIFRDTMNRVVWFLICTVVGLELLAWGLLVPAHIRAIDAKVLDRTGANSPSLCAEGLSLVNLEKTGPARMLLEVAEQTGAPDADKLERSLQSFEEAHPRLRVWGGAAPYLERLFEKAPPTTNLQSQPIVDLLVSQTTRDALMETLRHSRRPGVLDILQTRELTNTTVFPPARSASGQPLDAAIATTALLFQHDDFATGLRTSIQEAVSKANHGGEVQPLEAIYMDMLALGKRLNWGQLVDVIRWVPDLAGLQGTAELVRDKEAQLPVVYSAIHVSESPSLVRRYLDFYPTTGLRDLRFALRAGSEAVHKLVESGKPIQYPRIREKLVRLSPIRALADPLVGVVARDPVLGFVVKYGLCLLGALLLARSITYLSPSLVEEIVDSRPLLTGPQVALGLCLLSIVLFFSESLVPRAAVPAPEMPFRIKFPMASAALRATIPHQVRVMTDNLATLSLLIFFVLQATIYVFCRMKLAEIRRQTLPSKLKLRLLENEDNLFDAGLYFGFVGTVASLILVSMGIIKFSLMAAYSSTAFGIIFVSILKIFSVRPYRRRLILDAEIAERQTQPA